MSKLLSINQSVLANLPRTRSLYSHRLTQSNMSINKQTTLKRFMSNESNNLEQHILTKQQYDGIKSYIIGSGICIVFLGCCQTQNNDVLDYFRHRIARTDIKILAITDDLNKKVKQLSETNLDIEKLQLAKKEIDDITKLVNDLKSNTEILNKIDTLNTKCLSKTEVESICDSCITYSRYSGR